MPLRPVWAPTCPDGRLGPLPGPRVGQGLGGLIAKRPVDPAGGVDPSAEALQAHLGVPHTFVDGHGSPTRSTGPVAVFLIKPRHSRLCGLPRP